MRRKFGLRKSVAIFLYVALAIPTLTVVVASFSDTNVIRFPPEGLTLRWYRALLSDAGLIRGLMLSIQVAVVSALASALLGTMAGLALARARFRFRNAIETFILSPILLPNILIGLALLMVFSQVGLISTLGLTLGHVVIVVPFMARTVLASLVTSDETLPQAAAVLGATPFQRFRYVTLPLIVPGVFAGSVFAFLVSFNNVTISIWVSSPGKSTLPVVIFNRLQLVVDPSILSISTVMIAITFAIMLALDRKFSLFKALFR